MRSSARRLAIPDSQLTAMVQEDYADGEVVNESTTVGEAQAKPKALSV